MEAMTQKTPFCLALAAPAAHPGSCHAILIRFGQVSTNNDISRDQ